MVLRIFLSIDSTYIPDAGIRLNGHEWLLYASWHIPIHFPKVDSDKEVIHSLVGIANSANNYWGFNRNPVYLGIPSYVVDELSNRKESMHSFLISQIKDCHVYVWEIEAIIENSDTRITPLH